jgi:hypothetical protein
MKCTLKNELIDIGELYRKGLWLVQLALTNVYNRNKLEEIIRGFL